MASSLKDALLGAGLKASEPKPKPDRHAGKRHQAKGRPARAEQPKKRAPKPSVKDLLEDENLSLAAAYKARTAQEQRERDLAKRKKEAEAKAKRERIAKVRELIDGQILNDEKAEDSRYFEYSRKIRRVYVTPEQNAAISQGELGVIQSKGTYYIVPAEIARQVQEAAPEYLALLQDPEIDVVESSSDSTQTSA